MNLRCRAVAAALLALAGAPALAWDAPGHRLITLLALDGIPADAPSFLRDAETRAMIASQSCEPDRWRGTPSNYLRHENEMDHYLDVDDLAQFGLTLRTMPKLRYECVKAMVNAKRDHPEKVEPYDASKDAAATREWPGMVVYSIQENYAKLQASFRTLAILEKLADPARTAQLAQARANVVYHMGVLSHFVGDSSQPLHTTRHHHGWVGENPNGYTTDRGFHAKIDGGVIAHHALTYDALRGGMAYGIKVNAADTWDDVATYLERSFAKVEPLYQLEKTGDLMKETGKAFITERLADGGAMLAALYSAAWASSKPSEKDVSDFVFYDKLEGATVIPPRPAGGR